jgi:hypothetical protein
MKYWEEMRSKWGFGDGETVPHGADLFRKVYVDVVNALAERDGAEYRAYPFDRAGLHNWCMILIAPKDAEVDADGCPQGEADDMVLAAQIAEAESGYLDDLVQVEVSIRLDCLTDLLARIAG